MSQVPDNSIILHALKVEDRMVVFHDRVSGVQSMSPVAADKTTPPVPTWTDNGYQWAYWGDNDRLPTSMREKVEAVPIAGAALQRKIQMMTGEDLVWVKTEDYRRAGIEAEQVYNPEVEDWMEENRIETEWWPAQCTDFCLHYNAFSEFVLSKDRRKITGLYNIFAEHARLSKANSTTGQVDWLLNSLHFPFGTAESKDNRVAIPLYKWYDREAFFAGLQRWKFGWHTRFPTPGLIYYARPWWLGLFKENGWLDVSSDVPKVVRAMQKNQMVLKYMIAIPESYFEIRHGKTNWLGYTADQKQKFIDEKVAELNKYLVGVDNVFKSLSYVFREDEISKTPIGKIEIMAIDDKTKQGTWVPDSYAADAQIVQAFGQHPTTIGLAPQSGSMGGGSGSDKLQAYNQGILLNTTDQRLGLEPLNLMSKYNGWGLTCIVKHTHLTTQDSNRSGTFNRNSNDNPPGNEKWNC
jgi:hypothetical protein